MRDLPRNPNSGTPDPSDAPRSDGHINLFDDLEGFPLGDGEKKQTDEDGKSSQKKRKREDAAPRVVTAEDEKYRMGYGVAGKGVKEPWYLSRTLVGTADSGSEEAADLSGKRSNESVKKEGKKSVAELREERLKREKLEKKRTQNLLSRMNRNSDREDRKYSSSINSNE